MFTSKSHLKSSTTTSSIRPLWLLLFFISLAAIAILVILQNQDAILVIGLHLNFKMSFISDIEDQCESKGTPALILRSEEPPTFPWIDDCDRDDLGSQNVIIPDPQTFGQLLFSNASDNLDSYASLIGNSQTIDMVTKKIVSSSQKKKEYLSKIYFEQGDESPEELKKIEQQSKEEYRRGENSNPKYLGRISKGGKYKPTTCSASPKSKVAIIIPHRHREYHLKQLLSVLHPTLQRQKIEYTTFVIHQTGEGVFNKARLLNAGVREALRHDPTLQCFIMHDVDLVMEDEQNLYYCNPNLARHISAGIDKYNYELPYDGLFGGVVALTKDQFQKINGYSNEYWGWGCEDDDMFIRVVHSCVGLEHAMHKNAHYKMIYHPHDRENSINSNRFYKLIHAKERQYIDGYKQVGGLYKVVSVEEQEHLYTNITIDVGERTVAAADANLDDTESEKEDDNFEETIDVKLLILVICFATYTLYKSRLICYLYKKNQRATRLRIDSTNFSDFSASHNSSHKNRKNTRKIQKSPRHIKKNLEFSKEISDNSSSDSEDYNDDFNNDNQFANVDKKLIRKGERTKNKKTKRSHKKNKYGHNRTQSMPNGVGTPKV